MFYNRDQELETLRYSNAIQHHRYRPDPVSRALVLCSRSQTNGIDKASFREEEGQSRAEGCVLETKIVLIQVFLRIRNLDGKET